MRQDGPCKWRGFLDVSVDSRVRVLVGHDSSMPLSGSVKPIGGLILAPPSNDAIPSGRRMKMPSRRTFAKAPSEPPNDSEEKKNSPNEQPGAPRRASLKSACEETRRKAATKTSPARIRYFPSGFVPACMALTMNACTAGFIE